ncbi:hypothetical protein PMAYCL1PPCAC_01332, partial [Pristionchus mayeri]
MELLPPSLFPSHNPVLMPFPYQFPHPNPFICKNSLSFSAILANCRSVQNKLHYLSQILSKKYAMICLTETWLSPTFPTSLLLGDQDQYYNLFRRDRNSRGGGVAIILHSSISAAHIADETVPESHELLSVDVDINGDLIRIICAYRNPKANTFVQEPTRKENILDLLLCNHPGLISQTAVGPPFEMSDHSTVEFKFSMSHSSPAFTLRRDYRNADYDLINSQLANIDWTSAFSKIANVDLMYDLLISVIQKSIDTHVPWTKVSLSHGKLPPHIERLLGKRFQAWHKSINSNDPNDEHEFEILNRKFRKELQRYHKTIEKKIIESDDKNKFFRFMKRCANKSKGVEGLKTADGTLVMDDLGKANLLAETFVSVFTIDDGKLPNTGALPQLGTYEEPQFLRHEICSLIEKWKRSSCKTPENIDLTFIKRIAVPISEALEIIFRNSYQSGMVPSHWRHSIVTPVKKSPPKGNSPAPLQSAIDTIAKWSEEWQLPLAAHKCNSLHLGRANIKRTYSIGTTTLEQKEKVKDLGFVIQKNLSFSDHCATVSIKAKTTCHTILRALRTKNIEVLLKTYAMYIRPILESASSIFSPYQNKDKKELEKVQNYFTRRLFMRCLNHTWENMPSALDRNKKLGIDSLEKRRIAIDMRVATNLIRGKYSISNRKPHYFKIYYTRNGMNFNNPGSNHNYRHNSFFPRAARLLVNS